MSGFDKLKKIIPGLSMPELTTEHLHKAGAFGVVAVPRKPKVGERWEKGSFPLPTVVEVVAVEGDSVTVKHGSKRPVTLQLAEFLGQGFARYEGFLALPQDEPSEPAVPQMPKLGEPGSLKPVDERISDAFERLFALAKEDEDLDLVAVVGVIRALWMADAMIEGWRALAALGMHESGAGHLPVLREAKEARVPVEIGRWVPVDEKLPGEGWRVEVKFSKDGGAHSAVFRAGVFRSRGAEEQLARVAFWRGVRYAQKEGAGDAE